MRRLISSLVIAAFCVTGSASFAQVGAIKEGAKKAGSATKEVGKATVDVTKQGAKATAKGTKKVSGTQGRGPNDLRVRRRYDRPGDAQGERMREPRRRKGRRQSETLTPASTFYGQKEQ